MKIPIFNSLYSSNNSITSKKIDIKILNNLDFQKVDSKKFPAVNILKKLPEKSSLFETILVSINDKLVDLFLNNKIKFTDISKKMHNILDLNEYKKFKILKANKISQIMDLNKKISLKIETLNK